MREKRYYSVSYIRIYVRDQERAEKFIADECVKICGGFAAGGAAPRVAGGESCANSSLAVVDDFTSYAHFMLDFFTLGF